ncbi:ATP-binding protein [Tropicibacter sp. R15_0]|uniref:ATP-binding protein n=1 Tax=Tropicibacter sp. R15_0 TaxID=2821101 RepID=UPI001ADCCC73|nr:ATP-binding protein [Tropicibacter sp. R15_0]MBO9466379.1 ATP-binding protein [Tropicibacter sp. R15_0]
MTAGSGANDTLAFQYVLRSTPEAVRETLTSLREQLEVSDFHTCPGDMWEVVIAEVLNNIVEHAYKERPDGEIQLDVNFQTAVLKAHFVDCGSAMPQGALPEGKSANVDVEIQDMPEGGFGWYLIRTLSDELTYERRGRENHLSLEMPIQVVGG